MEIRINGVLVSGAITIEMGIEVSPDHGRTYAEALYPAPRNTVELSVSKETLEYLLAEIEAGRATPANQRDPDRDAIGERLIAEYRQQQSERQRMEEQFGPNPLRHNFSALRG